MPTQKVLNQIITKHNGIRETYTIGDIIEGYYDSLNDKFYKEDTFETEIEGASGFLYIDLSENTLYIYDVSTSSFVQVSGSGGGLEYVDTLPSPPDIKDAIYGYYSTVSYTETVAADFLDDNQYFDKTGDDYAPKSGVDLTISSDDTTYKTLVSLVLNGTDYDATYDDTTTHTFADGDTFYYKVGSIKFYAGDETNQVLYVLTRNGSEGGGDYAPGEGIDISNNVLSIKPATTSTLGGIKPDDKTVKVNINGELSGNYQGGYGIKISNDNEIETKTFVGTQAEWDNLTAAQKAKFDVVSITDDSTTLNNTPGHDIVDSTGTDMPQRSKLKFADETVTDDSTNDMTIITHTPYTAGNKIEITNREISCDETVKGTFIGTKAEWDALSAADKAKYDIVSLTDDEITPAAVVDTVADGNMNPVTSNAVADALKDVVKYVDITIDWTTATSESTIAPFTFYLGIPWPSSIPSNGHVISVTARGTWQYPTLTRIRSDNRNLLFYSSNKGAGTMYRVWYILK